MRIGIDARMIENTGIGRYLRNLLASLFRQGAQHDYVVFLNASLPNLFEAQHVTYVPLTPPVPVYSIQEQYRLPLEIKKWRLDMMHYPNFAIPLTQTCPYVITIHDLIYYLYPEECPSKVAHYYACGMLRYAARHARLVMTDSQHSKQDLQRHFKVPEQRIRVIYPAAETDYGPLETTRTDTRWNALKKRYGITQPYIFYVGKHHSYKNIQTLLRAYMSAPSIYEAAQLVVAGKRDARRKDLYELADAFQDASQIIWTDFVDDADLLTLYQHAGLFVFPSCYEGFGLPPLEAMACGVPVICSNAASLPEVVGDTAILFDPHNVSELAHAMHNVLTNEKERARLRRQGLQRVRQFSWEHAAAQVLEIYTAARK